MKNYLPIKHINSINPTINNIVKINTIGIQNGHNTHIHDQLITLQSLRTINVIPKIV